MADYTNADLAWFCGLFEGEGHVAHRKQSGRGSVTRCLVMRMTDQDVIERVHNLFGGRMNGPYTKNRKKPQYEWAVSRWAEVLPLATDMLPFMGQRRRHALETLLADPPMSVRPPYKKTQIV